jgi:hypothetical protein
MAGTSPKSRAHSCSLPRAVTLSLLYLVNFSKGGFNPSNESYISIEDFYCTLLYRGSALSFRVLILYIIDDESFNLVKCFALK